MQLALSKSGRSGVYVLLSESQAGLRLHDPCTRGESAYGGEGQFESGV